MQIITTLGQEIWKSKINCHTSSASQMNVIEKARKRDKTMIIILGMYWLLIQKAMFQNNNKIINAWIPSDIDTNSNRLGHISVSLVHV